MKSAASVTHRDDYYNQLERRLFLKDAVIFKEGGFDNDVYVVESGTVEIYKSDGESETSLAHLGPNAIFGEMALVTGDGRSASARALSDTTCFVIREQEFRQRLSNGAKLGHSLMRVLTDTVRTSTSRILEQSARIAHLEREVEDRDARISQLEKQVSEPAPAAEGISDAAVDTPDDDGPQQPKVFSSKGVVPA